MKVRCTVCRTYVDRDEAIRAGIVSYCGEDCLSEAARSRKKQGAARTTTKRRRESMSAELRDEVIAADGGRCRYCGTTTFLHAHHALYRSEGGKNVRENLLTLCDEHHQLVHSDKGKYQPLVLRIIAMRELDGNSRTTIKMLEDLL